MSSTQTQLLSPTEATGPVVLSTSIGDKEARVVGNESRKASYGKIVDTYGKEFKVPEYSFKQIKDAIPARCFEKSALTGFRYIVQDLSLIILTFYVFNTYVTESKVPSWYLRFSLWTLYTFLQGLFGIGVWVIAHECGHGAFSDSKTLNDITGWTLHSVLLVPYFSWKLSHKQHHALHNNLAKDMQFVPKSREEYGKHTGKSEHSNWEFTEEMPLRTAVELVIQQLIGWPRHLLTHDSASAGYQLRPDGRGAGKRHGLGKGVNHFNPYSPLFNADESHLILLSDLGLTLTLSATAYIGYVYGWVNILVWYWVPYLWVNHWLVAIAYLQHTDPSLPKYTPEAWTYTRGAAATIDRDFGFIGRIFFHEIIETHVLHHTIPSIPFYHAREATDAIKTVMGEHYRSDVREGMLGFMKSMWRSARWCQWVEACEGAEGTGKGVWFPRNSNGLGVPPMKLEGKL